MNTPSNHSKRRLIRKRLSSEMAAQSDNRRTPETSVESDAPPGAGTATGTDTLLTPVQTAELLGVTSGTLSVWRSTERYPLKYIKLGGLIRYRLSDVREFLRSRTKPGVSIVTGGDL